MKHLLVKTGYVRCVTKSIIDLQFAAKGEAAGRSAPAFLGWIEELCAPTAKEFWVLGSGSREREESIGIPSE